MRRHTGPPLVIKLSCSAIPRAVDPANYQPLILHIGVCRLLCSKMPTNLAIDDRLIEEAKKLGKHRTKKEAVTAALDEYVRRHKQMEIISLFGTVDFDPSYNYKRERRAKLR